MRSNKESEKERRKVLARVSKEEQMKKLELEKLDDTTQLKIRIDKLKSEIKNCEYDLNGHFRGNKVIENKMNIAKKYLDEEEEKLNSILLERKNDK